LIAEKLGADSITIHLREDRRHIRDSDLKNLKKKLKIPLNLEMAPTNQMLKIALREKPNFVCLVPEKRKEITTEGGLNLFKKEKKLKNIIYNLKKKNIRVSLFIEANIKVVKKAHLLKADCVEFHTGLFCNALNNNSKKKIKFNYNKIYQSSKFAKYLGLDVHAGHGLTYKSTQFLSKIRYISEFNIGHFIISESIFLGIKNVIRKFKKILG